MTAANGEGPAVTVLVATYKPDFRFVRMAESLARQTWTNMRVHVSIDHDAEQQLPEIPEIRGLKVFRQESRLGWVGNVNWLLKTVETPYFINLAHDDGLSPEYLSRAVEILEQRSEVVVVHGALRYFGVVRDGQTEFTPSISGKRIQRIGQFLERKPHRAELGWRGVARSSLLKSGLRLRARLSDGQFSNTLWALELLLHGESVGLEDIAYEKYTYQDGLSRDLHKRTSEERSAMLADNVACLVDALNENAVKPLPKERIVTAYVKWLLALQGNWNIIADEPKSDKRTYAEVRGAMAIFVTKCLASGMTRPEPKEKPRRGH